jgi:hypothetical protein
MKLVSYVSVVLKGVYKHWISSLSIEDTDRRQTKNSMLRYATEFGTEHSST